MIGFGACAGTPQVEVGSAWIIHLYVLWMVRMDWFVLGVLGWCVGRWVRR